MPQIAFSVPSLLTFELIQNPAHLHIISRSVQQVKSFATYSLWRAFDLPSRNRCSLQSVPARSSMRLDALAEVAFRQVQVSFQILRRSQFRHVPGSKHSKRFFSKSFDSSRNFETT
jgi:hypothetical protein